MSSAKWRPFVSASMCYTKYCVLSYSMGVVSTYISLMDFLDWAGNHLAELHRHEKYHDPVCYRMNNGWPIDVLGLY